MYIYVIIKIVHMETEISDLKNFFQFQSSFITHLQQTGVLIANAKTKVGYKMCLHYV